MAAFDARWMERWQNLVNQDSVTKVIGRHFTADVLLEFGSAAVAGIEVKAAATVVEADFRGLRKLREAAGQRFRSGVVLYDGTASVSFGDGLFAVPIRHVWETQ